MSSKKAIFAAGCFWGVQYYFDQVPGVTKTTVGYTGGHTVNPTYDDVVTHTTGHAEAVLVEFDDTTISYSELLQQFFHMHDPTQLNRQGPDIGDSYRTAIFYFDQEQRREAIHIRNQVQRAIGQPVVTEITPVGPFYEAESFHQKFTERTGIGMCHIPYEPQPHS
jgi:methionine-S-sulfoxide reductase